MNEPIITVRNLKKYYPQTGGLFHKTRGWVKAVDGISCEIHKGETLGLVGESGCGKSTAGRTMLRLCEKTGGDVFFKGTDIYSLGKESLRRLRPKMQIIFQDPYGALNPRMNVGSIIGEALLEHRLCSPGEVMKRVMLILEDCGLPSGAINRYPHEFSGGQRQRICIARALAVKPEFIVADEPVSALDVSIQAQIINLLKDLMHQHSLACLFISHDLSVVEHIADRVGIMYLGTIVEIGSKEEVLKRPCHPYTKVLISAVTVPDPTKRKPRIILKGDIPSPADPPTGCRFNTRCPIATEKCRQVCPELIPVGRDHFAACHKL